MKKTAGTPGLANHLLGQGKTPAPREGKGGMP